MVKELVNGARVLASTQIPTLSVASSIYRKFSKMFTNKTKILMIAFLILASSNVQLSDYMLIL